MGLKSIRCTCGVRTWHTGNAIVCTSCGNLFKRSNPNNVPIWVNLIERFKSPEDTGIGDTVQRYAAMLGGEAFKAWSEKLGMPCGCTQRQAEWNAKYPYTAQPDQQKS